MNGKIARLIIISLILWILIQMLPTNVHAENTKIVTNSYGRILSSPPKNINGVICIPLRSCFESLKWNVSYCSKDRTVVCIKGYEKLIFKKDSNNVCVNGENVELDCPMYFVNGRAYIPSKFIAQNFGIKIRWNKKDNLIIVSDKDTSSVTVNGARNVVISGDGMIVNIFEPYCTDTLNDMVNDADSLLTKNFAQDALQKYKEILENISQEENPDVYGHVVNNMGNAYSLLAGIRDMKKNISNAVQQYQLALKIYKPDNDIVDYSITINNLANAYKVLAEVTGDKEYLNKAILNYQEAIKMYSQKKYILDYALIQTNMGIVYNKLGLKELAGESLLRAAETYEQALKQYSIEKNPDTYAVIKYNEGNVFKTLSYMKDESNSLKISLTAYDEALKVWNIESYPLDYARGHSCLGDVYKRSYEVDGEEAQEALQKAMLEYNESLKFYTLETYPIDYAKLNFEKGNTYLLMALGENREKELSDAVFAYEEALKVFNITEYPSYYQGVSTCLSNVKRMQNEN